MRSFEEDLKGAIAYHGHLCGGQVLGVRVARAGLKALNIEDAQDYRDLIVYVEMDRCAADAIAWVTGRRLGRRTLKVVDYGKMAATFVDLRQGKAVRVSVPEVTRELAMKIAGDDPKPYVAAYLRLSDEELLRIEEVEVDIPPEDLPGRPIHKAICARCGERVNDGREVRLGGETLCKACAFGAYYRKAAGDDGVEPGDVAGGPADERGKASRTEHMAIHDRRAGRPRTRGIGREGADSGDKAGVARAVRGTV